MKRRITAVLMLIAVLITSVAPGMATESYETVPPVVITPAPEVTEMPVNVDGNAGVSAASDMDTVTDATVEPAKTTAASEEPTATAPVATATVPAETSAPAVTVSAAPSATAVVTTATAEPVATAEPAATETATAEPAEKLNAYFSDCSKHVFANEACIAAEVVISGGTPGYTVRFVIDRYDTTAATLTGTVNEENKAAVYWMPNEYGKYIVKVYIADAAGNEIFIENEVRVAERIVETEADWDESVAGVQLTDDWNQDILAIAVSQLGYTESSINFIINDEGAVKGYTRYGHRFGMNYDEWCAMFVSFCLDYAGIDEYYYPRGIRSREIRQDLLYKGGYEDNEDEYIPVPGDLIFFASDEEHTNDYPHSYRHCFQRRRLLCLYY